MVPRTTSCTLSATGTSAAPSGISPLSPRFHSVTRPASASSSGLFRGRVPALAASVPRPAAGPSSGSQRARRRSGRTGTARATDLARRSDRADLAFRSASAELRSATFTGRTIDRDEPGDTSSRRYRSTYHPLRAVPPTTKPPSMNDDDEGPDEADSKAHTERMRALETAQRRKARVLSRAVFRTPV